MGRIGCGGMAESKRNCLVHSLEVDENHGMDNQMWGMIEYLKGTDCRLRYGIGQAETSLKKSGCSFYHRTEEFVGYLHVHR